MSLADDGTDAIRGPILLVVATCCVSSGAGFIAVADAHRRGAARGGARQSKAAGGIEHVRVGETASLLPPARSSSPRARTPLGAPEMLS